MSKRFNMVDVNVQSPTRQVDNARQDLIWVASQLQNDPKRYARALADKATRKEFTRLVSDLYSLIEVISQEESEG